METWLKIYITKSPAQASIIQGMLEENNIPVQVMNKQSSSFNFGDIEIYVPAHLLETAKQLMAANLLN